MPSLIAALEPTWLNSRRRELDGLEVRGQFLVAVMDWNAPPAELTKKVGLR